MKIALVGSAPSSLGLAPWKDASYDKYLGGMPAPQYPPEQFIGEDWKIFGCSPGAWSQAQRADVWFELHRWEPGQTWFSPQYCQFLQQFRGTVFTGAPVPDIPNHVVYPIERVEAEFSSYFLTSSLALMAAIAILEIEEDRARTAPTVATKADLDKWRKDRGDVIAFFGVDMAANDEYTEQKPGCHFFILEALRRGIGVYTPAESCLLRPSPIYGISEWDHSYIKATTRARELNGRRQAAEQQVQENMKTANFMAGAIDNHNYWIKTWMSPYGLPAGIVLNHTPGSGLGGGVTLPRPFSPPPDNVIDAAAAGPGPDLDIQSGDPAPKPLDFIPNRPTPKKKRPGIKPAAKRRK